MTQRSLGAPDRPPLHRLYAISDLFLSCINLVTVVLNFEDNTNTLTEL